MKKLGCSFFVLVVCFACMEQKKTQETKVSTKTANFSFREVSELPLQPTLPNLMVNRFGDSIQSLKEWKAHKAYIKEMLTFYQYGQTPPKPIKVKVVETDNAVEDGKVHSSYDFTLTNNQQSLTFRVGLIRPQNSEPHPVIIKNDRYRFDLSEIHDKKVREKYTRQDRLSIDFFAADTLVQRGYIYCKFNREDVFQDVKGPKNGGIFDLYPGYDWGAITAWAWTYQIIIDWLEHQPFVDREKIVVTGHSRGGKTALCTGIYDERIALTAPNSSGLGGTASMRYYDFSKGPEVQTSSHQLKRFPHWWPNRWYALENHTARIPFDAHFAKALIAPRALLNTHARQDYWANPYGTQLTYLYAQPVFELYGVANHNAIHWRDGGHAQKEEDWLALLDFCDSVFYGKKPKRVFNENPFPDTYQYQVLNAHDITKLKPVSSQ